MAKKSVDLNSTARFGVSMTVEEANRLKKLAEVTERSVSEQVRAALRFYEAHLDEALQEELEEKAVVTKRALKQALSSTN